MLLLRPITDVSFDDKDSLANFIYQNYQFLGADLSDLLTVEFFLEKNNLLQKKHTNQALNVTSGALVELIVNINILRYDLGLSEDKIANVNLSLFELFSSSVWGNLINKNFIPEYKQNEIKNLVWESFLNRLKKDKNLRLFDIKSGEIAFKQTLFQDYFNSQMIIFTLRESELSNNKKELVVYEDYFRNLLKTIFKWNIKYDVGEDNFQDLVSERVFDFWKYIKNDEFKLTSSLNTFFYKFMTNGLKNHFDKHKPQMLDIEDDELYLSFDERKILEENTEKELLRDSVVKECKKGEVKDQMILLMSSIGKSGQEISTKLNITETLVSTRKKRFITRIQRNLNVF
jgi:RNA polymerase sigma factor (sigma-70 family)